MRCIHSFLPSNLAGYKSNNSCSASTHTDARKGRLTVAFQSRTVLEKPALEAERVKPHSRLFARECNMRLFATALLLMHVQGNQKLLGCLEEKQRCRRTEQRKQLAHKVPHQLAANATGTHRGRLYTARAWDAVTGSFMLDAGWAGTFQGNSRESTQFVLESHHG